MKGCVAAAVVLCVVILLVAINAVYVRRVADNLCDRLEALPEHPDPTTTPDAVAAIRRRLEAHTTTLSLSVNFALPDRIGESLCALEAYAREGDGAQYAATRAVLLDLCRDLSRAERFDLENLS